MLNFFDFWSRPALFVIGPAWFLIRSGGERREASLLTFSKPPQMLHLFLCCCLIRRSIVSLPWFRLRCVVEARCPSSLALPFIVEVMPTLGSLYTSAGKSITCDVALVFKRVRANEPLGWSWQHDSPLPPALPRATVTPRAPLAEHTPSMPGIRPLSRLHTSIFPPSRSRPLPRLTVSRLLRFSLLVSCFRDFKLIPALMFSFFFFLLKRSSGTFSRSKAPLSALLFERRPPIDTCSEPRACLKASCSHWWKWTFTAEVRVCSVRMEEGSRFLSFCLRILTCFQQDGTLMTSPIWVNVIFILLK